MYSDPFTYQRAINPTTPCHRQLVEEVYSKAEVSETRLNQFVIIFHYHSQLFTKQQFMYTL